MSRELEPIIRKIDKRSQALPGGVVVAIDPKTRKTISDPWVAITRHLWQDVVLYEVTVNETHWIENARSAIAVFLTNERSDLVFRMRVTAPREKAVTIAEALHHHKLSPSEVLFKTIRDYLGKLLDNPAEQGPESVIERISANRSAWQAEIVRVIESKLHLAAEIIFEMQRPIIDTDVTVRAEAIQVFAKDAPHAAFPITVSVVLARTQSRANDLLPRSNEERQNLVRDVVIKAFRDRLVLYVYWFQPDGLANEISVALSTALARYAYSLKSLSIDPIVPPVTAEEQIVDDVSWTGRLARPIPFHIETKVRMLQTGAGIYHARGLPNRKAWIKTEVHDALQSAMHGRDFIDLTAEAEQEVHNTVHHRLNERARSIGHDVDTFVASAAIPEKIWLKPTTVEVERREYKTKNDLVPAEFEIDLVVELTTLARLEQLIQAHRLSRPNDAGEGANAAIRAAIVECATRAAGRIMSQIEPKDYFSKFERWEFPADDDEPGGKQNYVRNQLIRAIRTELKAEFHVTRCEVNPRRVDSRVAAIVRLIQRIGDLKVEVDVEPQHSEGPHQSVHITIVYHIGGVAPDEWANVIQRGEAALPKEMLTANLDMWSREVLRGRPLDQLYGLTSQRASDWVVRQELETYVSARMALHSGVVVGVKSIDRDYTDVDKVRRDIEALPTRHDQAKLEKLKRAVKELTTESDDEMRRNYLRDRRKIVQQLINANPRSESEDFERLGEHERELEKIERELQVANKTLVRDDFRRLDAPGAADQPAEPFTDAPSNGQSQPRDTSL